MDPADFARLDERLDQHGKVLERIDHALNGNGKPGLLVRVDRLEQTEESRRRFTSWIAGTAVAGLAVALWAGVKQLIRS